MPVAAWLMVVLLVIVVTVCRLFIAACMWPIQIDRTGNLLLVGNQYSDSIVSFAIDGATGELTPTGAVCTGVPSPVALCSV